MTRMLYDRGYDRQDILELFRFIDWLMILPDELDDIFWEELKHIEEDKKMPYVTSIERIGIRKGIQQGVQQGIQQGVQQGVQQGSLSILRRQIIRRFGGIPPWVEKMLEKADPGNIEKWADRILDAESLELIFR